MQFRIVLIAAAAFVAAAAGCRYPEGPDPTPTPPLPPATAVVEPVVHQPAPECPQPDVTYFVADDEWSAQILLGQLANADRIRVMANEPIEPWAVIVQRYSAPEPWMASGRLPSQPRTVTFVEFDVPPQ